MLGSDEKVRGELRYDERLGKKTRITGEIKSKIVDSNLEAVEKKRAYIKAARAEAEEMKLKAIPHDEVIRRLEELKAGMMPDYHRSETTEVPLVDVRELRA
jgi:hypothetical protein